MHFSPPFLTASSSSSRIFEKGQAYVALSRIKTLNGLYLHNFNPAKVMVDNTVVEFYKNLKIFDKKVELTENININDFVSGLLVGISIGVNLIGIVLSAKYVAKNK